MALRGLLGEGAPLSPSSVARLKGKWQAEYEAWRSRSLGDEEVVYVWVDGVYVKAGFEKEKAALLVVIGALRDGSKVVLAVETGYRESIQSWAALLRDLKARGMSTPKLVIGDGHLGIWGALTEVYPAAGEQRCWNHRIVNVLDQLPKKAHAPAKALLTRIPYAETRQEATKQKGTFRNWCHDKGFSKAAELLDVDWERMVAFYDFPKAHWKHIRTTNPIESTFATVRLRTTKTKGCLSRMTALTMVFKLCQSASKKWRRLDGSHQLVEIIRGVKFKDGEKLIQRAA